MSANDGNFSVSPKGQSIGHENCFVSDPMAIKVARIAAYCILMITSLVGNSVIISVVLREARMRKTFNFFIVNICVADLLITLYMPRVISLSYAGYEWQLNGTLGLILCKLSAFIHETAITASIFTVVAISADRFLAVVFPLKNFVTKNVCRLIIAGIWASAVIIHLPMMYGLKIDLYKSGKLFCFLSLDNTFNAGRATRTYYKFTLITLFAVPLSVIAVLYSGILISLKLRKVPGDEVQVSADSAGRERQTRNSVVRKKVLRQVLIVVALFVVCWLLYFIWLILWSYNIHVSCEVLFLRLFLAHLNSALNPCLCLLLNENFREGFKDILRRYSLRRHIIRRKTFPLNPVNLISRGPQRQDEQTWSKTEL